MTDSAPAPERELELLLSLESTLHSERAALIEHDARALVTIARGKEALIADLDAIAHERAAGSSRSDAESAGSVPKR